MRISRSFKGTPSAILQTTARYVIALSMFAAVALFDVTVTANPAIADCHGPGDPHTIVMGKNFDNSGPVIGIERAYAGTCDGDSYYHGRVYDKYTDGSCVFVRYWDNNYYGTQGRSCDSDGYGFSFTDTNGDSHSLTDICTKDKCRYWTNDGGDDEYAFGY